MNKKEVAEIKKNFSSDCGFFTMGKVLSALIDPEKNIVYQIGEENPELIDSLFENKNCLIIRYLFCLNIQF